MSFLIKHQIMHVIRQRQQKKIAEENSVYFDILQKALPQEPSQQENERDKVSVEEGTVTAGNGHSDHRDGRPRISPKGSHGGGGGGGGKSSNRERISSSSGGKHGRSGGSRVQDHRSNSSSSKTQSTNDHNHQTAHGAATVAMPNGDLPRPSSAGKVHVVSGKKQLAVKAVPRSNQLPQTAATVATGNTQDTTKDKVVNECVCVSECVYVCVCVFA